MPATLSLAGFSHMCKQAARMKIMFITYKMSYFTFTGNKQKTLLQLNV